MNIIKPFDTKMADTSFALISCGLLIFTGTVVNAGDYCTSEDDYLPYTRRTFWCANGCCGSYNDEYCCFGIDSDALTTAAIIGIVIGCLFFLAIIVGTIIAIYCCLKGRRAHGGAVYGRNAGGALNMTTVSSSGQGVTVQTGSTVPTYPQGAYPQTGYYPQGHNQPIPMAGYPLGNASPPTEGEKPPPY